MKLREKIYDLVEPRRIDTHKARTYDSIMLLAVDLSLLPHPVRNLLVFRFVFRRMLHCRLSASLADSRL